MLISQTQSDFLEYNLAQMHTLYDVIFSYENRNKAVVVAVRDE